MKKTFICYIAVVLSNNVPIACFYKCSHALRFINTYSTQQKYTNLTIDKINLYDYI